MTHCVDASPLVASWAILIPLILVCLWALTYIPTPIKVSQRLHSLQGFWGDKMTLERLRLYLSETSQTNSQAFKRLSDTRERLLSSFCLLQCILCSITTLNFQMTDPAAITQEALLFVVWLVLACRPILHPLDTPHYPSLILYVYLFSLSLHKILLGSLGECKGQSILALEYLHLALALCLVMITLSTKVLSGQTRDHYQGRLGPQDDITLWENLTFTWMKDLIKVGSSRQLEEEDVPKLSVSTQSSETFKVYKRTSATGLVSRLFKMYTSEVVYCVTMWNLGTTADYYAIYLTYLVLGNIADGNSNKAYKYAFLALFSRLLKDQVRGLGLTQERKVYIAMRGQLAIAIYEKALKRKEIVDKEKNKESATDKQRASVGQIYSMMSGEVDNLSWEIHRMKDVLSALIDFVFALVFLWSLIGWPCLGAILVTFINTPVVSLLAKRTGRLFRARAIKTDTRLTLFNELINNLKSTKLAGMTMRWRSRIHRARQKELSSLRKLYRHMVFYLSWCGVVPIVMAGVTFALVIFVAKQELDTALLFTIFTLLNRLIQPLEKIPEYASEVATAIVSVKRLAKYLVEEEVDPGVGTLGNYAVERTARDMLGFEHATLSWNGSAVKDAVPSDRAQSTTFRLNDLTCEIPIAKLTVVTGPTGSGKSAFLNALLGEMTLISGKVLIDKHSHLKEGSGVAYASQIPWIRSATIKENIVMHEALDEERLAKVIKAAALEVDLLLLGAGVDTEIGARGVNLSGGQKARVSFARCLYSSSKLVFLDDILSACDSGTIRQLVAGLSGSLLEDRTVVLVSHHLRMLTNHADYIIQLDQGAIVAQGDPLDLQAMGKLDHIVAMETQEATRNALVDSEGQKEIAKVDKGDGKLTSKEARQEGLVGLATYQSYFAASGVWLWSLNAFLYLVVRVIRQVELYWLAVWGESYDQADSTGSHPSWLPLPRITEHPGFYLGMFIGLRLAGWVAEQIFFALTYVAGYEGVKTFHDGMLDNVLGSTCRWLDITPTGRISNRFTSDIASLEVPIINSIRGFSRRAYLAFASLVTMSMLSPWLTLLAAVVVLIQTYYTRQYLATTRDLKRLQKTSFSSIVSGFEEVLQGVITIRAFGDEKEMLDQFSERFDTSQAPLWSLKMANRYLQYRIDIIGDVANAVTALLAIATMSEGLAGVAITCCGNFVTSAYALSEWIGIVEQQFVSVERAREYLTDVPQEPSAIFERHRPPAHWPSDTAKEFLVVQDLRIRYADNLPDSLKGVSFAIKAKEKIGILGRTGSGKSTLALSLLRFTEPTTGKIILDGIESKSIGTQDWRERITYLPQEPVLVAGTLRTNLDVFEEHTDAELEKVMVDVGLAGSYETDSSGSDTSSTVVGGHHSLTLDSHIAAGGKNISAGQAQLVAMGRAILQRNALVLMDEPSSSVDFETDQKLIETIRTEFVNSAVITIAHRIATVIAYDRVMVMDAGEIVEFDTPAALLKKPGSLFKQLCIQSGDLEGLTKAAEK